jgi:hypothetical protein
MVLRLGTAAAGFQQTDKIVFSFDAPAANGASPCTGLGTGEVFAPRVFDETVYCCFAKQASTSRNFRLFRIRFAK